MTASLSPLTDRRWSIDAVEVGRGRNGRILATEDECKQLAASLGLQECGGLEFSYAIEPLSRHRFRLRADLTCHVVQTCVVTLDPLPAHIVESSDSELVPENDASLVAAEESTDIVNEPVIETYNDGRIDFGRIAFELLSVSLDPFPRKPGAELPADDTAGKLALSPFAALAQLKRS